MRKSITFEEIDEFGESLKYYGFWERKVFQFGGYANQSTKEILSEILQSEIFFETQKCADYRGEKPRYYEIRTNYAFTDKIEIDDFEQFTFEKYETRITRIKEELDWGEDLPIFSELTTRSKKWITENNYQNEYIYFLYAESVDQDKLIENNYYLFLMSIIIISISKSKVIIINHGVD